MLTVYSKANCPFCDKAKNLLRLKGIEYTEVRVDQDPQLVNLLLAKVIVQFHKFIVMVKSMLKMAIMV